MMKTNDTHSLLFLAGVFLTCMCGLMLQIMETRMLSVIGQYNGAAGVLASGVVVMVSIATSLNHSLWLGAAAYALLAGVGPQLLKLEQASEGKDHCALPEFTEDATPSVSNGS